MKTKDIALILIVVGLFLTIYEYWFSFPPKRIIDQVYFPISPNSEGLAIPVYSVAILIVGALMFIAEYGNDA